MAAAAACPPDLPTSREKRMEGEAKANQTVEAKAKGKKVVEEEGGRAAC